MSMPSAALLVPLIVITFVFSCSARAEVTWHTLGHGGTTTEYALVRPSAEFTGPRPALLALPPGNQSRAMVEAGLGRSLPQRDRSARLPSDRR